MQELLTVEDLQVHFPITKGILSRTVGYVYAVDGVSFTLNQGEIVGIVGESGCGKTTTGLSILRLVEPTGGKVMFQGTDVAQIADASLKAFRQKMQVIFQDPYSSLNPRMTLRRILAEPMKIHGIYQGSENAERITYLLESVGLKPEQMNRYPHQFSGGQRQRIGIARALCLDPQVIIGDEPVSALDVSIQAQIINLLLDLQQKFDLSYIIITHDLSVVEHLCDRIIVMYLGKFVEIASYHDLYTNPKHPYTQALLSAIPMPDPKVSRKRIILTGEVPSPINPPSGCRFHPRC
ncbi:ATP-binding cassette domain-containing protein, partial [candidate division KSB3 bacterium]|nr:ATP-binding cassette domain-containing protein [candidate division KSB3 bacterium]MBD3323888.1 ATP-binding cassette domain-containing protein [candidate division KSB3 bacterium]